MGISSEQASAILVNREYVTNVETDLNELKSEIGSLPDGYIFIGNANGETEAVQVQGDATIGINGVSITADAINTAKILNETILNEDISANAAIDQSKIDGLEADLDLKANLEDPTFTGKVTATTFIGDGSQLTNITSAIVDGAITSAMILNETITGFDIADNAINTDLITNGTIVDADISTSAAIAQSKIDGLSTSLTTISQDITNNTTLINDAIAGAGLETDGTYVPGSKTNYINAETSLASALEVLDYQIKTNESSAGLVSITEGENTGYRFADANPANYGDIGIGAVDLSVSTSASATFGATGYYSTAMGYNATASGDASTAMGILTIAGGIYSTAMGYNATASGFTSTAMGSTTTAEGDYSTAMGLLTTASGNYSTAMGNNTKASDYGSVVIGQYNDAGSTATSATVYSAANPALVIGNGTDSTALSDAFVVDFSGNTTAAGTVTATGGFIGDGSQLTNLPSSGGGLQSITENGNTGYRRADANAANYGDIGIGAVDLSFSDIVSDTSAFGATGYYSTAMGRATTASSIYSTAMGNYTVASGGEGATAMGSLTIASGISSTAMGSNTEASGNGSTAMGGKTRALGNGSTAMGASTTASGDMSIAMGASTIASDYGSVVIGQYNSAGATITSNATSYAVDNTAFVIGNGTDEANVSDAFVVDFSGNTTAAGTVTATGGFIGDGSQLTNLPSSGGGLQSVTEGANTGYRRADAIAANFGDIGLGAVDLSNSPSASTTMGATGENSIAMGESTTASAPVSVAMGYSTIASDYGSVVLGQYNNKGSVATSATTFSATAPALVIGNGAGSSAKSDAFVVDFSGNITASGSMDLNGAAATLNSILADDPSNVTGATLLVQAEPSNNIALQIFGNNSADYYSGGKIVFGNYSPDEFGVAISEVIDNELAIRADYVSFESEDLSETGVYVDGRIWVQRGGITVKGGNLDLRTGQYFGDGSMLKNLSMANTSGLQDSLNAKAPKNNPTFIGAVTADSFIGDAAGLTGLSFTTNAGVTSNGSGIIASDDFVFGSNQLKNDNTTTDDDSRFFFDKSKGAFRAGAVDSDQWDEAGIGNYSIGMGYNSEANGDYSVGMGFNSAATDKGSVALGSYTIASGVGAVAMGATQSDSDIQGPTSQGRGSVALGIKTNAIGDGAVALGIVTEAGGAASFAFGENTLSSGDNALSGGFSSKARTSESIALGYFAEANANRSMAIGQNVTANAYGEIVFGRYNDPITLNKTQWLSTDPLFTVGNGSSSSSLNNAFQILKNGNATLDGILTADKFVGNGSGLTGITVTASLNDGDVTTAKILNETIVNEDISATAAIAQTKIAGLTTALAGKQNTIDDGGLSIAKTDGLQAALDTKATLTALNAKAPLASPTFTGTVSVSALKWEGGSSTDGKILISDTNGNLLLESLQNASETTSGIVSTANQTFAGAKTFTGDVEAKRFVLTKSNITAATSTNINLSNGNVFSVSLGTNITTLSVSSVDVGTYLIKFVQDATGDRAVTFPSDWLWSGGTAPTVTATAGKTDIVTLIYDGTAFYAAISQNF